MLTYFTENGCIYYFNDFKPHAGPAGCDAVWEAMQNLTGDLNWYDLYRVEPSIIPTVQNREGKAMIGGVEKTYKRGMTHQEYTPWATHFKNKPQSRVMNDMLSDYVNNATTREALHIPSYAPGWDMCWGEDFTYDLQNEASIWIYPILKGAGIKLMFYSGDTDGAVPTWGSRRWIN